ncbi:MAG: helix-turn-helix domain-containing protein, partial [Planctomycetota bacterium]
MAWIGPRAPACPGDGGRGGQAAKSLTPRSSRRGSQPTQERSSHRSRRWKGASQQPAEPRRLRPNQPAACDLLVWRPLRSRRGVGDEASSRPSTACEVFALKGYRDARVADICTRAGANLDSVNYYFGDKASLYRE